MVGAIAINSNIFNVNTTLIWFISPLSDDK